MRKARDQRDRHGIPFLQLADAFPHLLAKGVREDRFYRVALAAAGAHQDQSACVRQHPVHFPKRFLFVGEERHLVGAYHPVEHSGRIGQLHVVPFAQADIRDAQRTLDLLRD